VARAIEKATDIGLAVAVGVQSLHTAVCLAAGLVSHRFRVRAKRGLGIARLVVGTPTSCADRQQRGGQRQCAQQ
jgi:hypothetical protein